MSRAALIHAVLQKIAVYLLVYTHFLFCSLGSYFLNGLSVKKGQSDSRAKVWRVALLVP